VGIVVEALLALAYPIFFSGLAVVSPGHFVGRDLAADMDIGYSRSLQRMVAESCGPGRRPGGSGSKLGCHNQRWAGN